MSFYGADPVLVNETVTSVTATPSVEPGFRVNSAGNDYIYVYNTGGTVIAKGHGAVIQSGASGYSVTVSSVTSADFGVGVAVVSIPAASYGWLQTKGIAVIEAIAGTGGTIDSMQNFELGANGAFAPVSNTSGGTLPGAFGNICGKALAEIVSGASGSAYVAF
jgi:hypothetical protein